MKNDLTAFGIACVFFGGKLFFQSFKKFKRLQIIQNTPKSKINSAALGNKVEIHGKIHGEKDHQTLSPLTRSICVNYVWAIDEIHRSKSKNGHTVNYIRIFTYFSNPFFYITDESKEIAAVDFSSCEFHGEEWHFSQNFHSHDLGKLPAKVKEILLTKGIIEETKKTFLPSDEYRISEMILPPEKKIYVIGTAKDVPKIEKPIIDDHQKGYGNYEIDSTHLDRSILEGEEKDHCDISKFDDNRNLVLDEFKNKNLQKNKELRVQTELKESLKIDCLTKARFLLCKSKFEDLIFNLGKVFVSFESEEKIKKSFSFWIKLGFFGGPILITIGILILIDSKMK